MELYIEPINENVQLLLEQYTDAYLNNGISYKTWNLIFEVSSINEGLVDNFNNFIQNKIKPILENLLNKIKGASTETLHKIINVLDSITKKLKSISKKIPSIAKPLLMLTLMMVMYASSVSAQTLNDSGLGRHHDEIAIKAVGIVEQNYKDVLPERTYMEIVSVLQDLVDGPIDNPTTINMLNAAHEVYKQAAEIHAEKEKKGIENLKLLHIGEKIIKLMQDERNATDIIDYLYTGLYLLNSERGQEMIKITNSYNTNTQILIQNNYSGDIDISKYNVISFDKNKKELVISNKDDTKTLIFETDEESENGLSLIKNGETYTFIQSYKGEGR